jgi:hypothetical protein
MTLGVAWLSLNSSLHAQCQTWSTEFGQSVGTAYAFQVFDDGTGAVLWVGGNFCIASTTGDCNVTRWNGHQCVDTPWLDDNVLCLGVHDDGTGNALYAGGYFSNGVSRWTGVGWTSPGGGLVGGPFAPAVYALATFDPGAGARLYAGGAGFYAGTGGDAIACWDGQLWTPLGTGLLNPGFTPPRAIALQSFDDGTGPELYVGGLFTVAGSVAVNGLARWDGTQWSAVGTNGSNITAFAVFDDGNGAALYATGTFQIPAIGTVYLARWDGTTWNAVAAPGGGYSLAVGNDGNGPALFSESSIGEVIRWDGQHWGALGSGVNGHIWAMNVCDEGIGNGPELFIGGQFTQAGGGIASYGIAKWTTCSSSVESFCPGDATLAACPCQNSGQAGRGCDNSLATGGAQLVMSGTTSPDTLVMTSQYELPSALSIFLQGNAESQLVQPFGDGLRCVGGQLLRLYVKSAHNGTAIAPRVGDPSITARAAALGDQIAPGAHRYYQVYYRDPNPSFCAAPAGGTFNVSNGVRVVW